MTAEEINGFITRQMAAWSLARRNHDALNAVATREITVNGQHIILQHNPARALSSGADVRTEAVAARPCFLCGDNRPTEQTYIESGNYQILLNPYPIFPGHLPIAHREHTPQAINERIADMLHLTDFLPGMTIFYNGPRCGASAPDHAHFQGVGSHFLPIWQDIEADCGTTITNGIPSGILITATDITQAERMAEEAIDKLPRRADAVEPMVNILTRRLPEMYQVLIIPRKCHRPGNFTTDPDDNAGIFVSPASIDVAGVIVTPRLRDFENLTEDAIFNLLTEVCYMHNELSEILK